MDGLPASDGQRRPAAEHRATMISAQSCSVSGPRPVTITLIVSCLYPLDQRTPPHSHPPPAYTTKSESGRCRPCTISLHLNPYTPTLLLRKLNAACAAPSPLVFGCCSADIRVLHTPLCIPDYIPPLSRGARLVPLAPRLQPVLGRRCDNTSSIYINSQPQDDEAPIRRG